MTNSEPADETDAVVLALREYQAAVDAGTPLDRAVFLANHPTIASELAECLDGLEFLRSAAPGLSTPNESTQLSPLQSDGTLGDFRIVREIGRGGMGVVYEAVQISLGRRVALKVLPVAATLDPRQLRRFENEARAAAGLHHTHIVPVFAVGCDRGVPYYAMQLIEGQPLSVIISQLRQAPRPGPASVDTASVASGITRQPADSPAFFRLVATLGAQAAEALEYAHQMGIVHRDVKPANLILDGRDHLWVTDFGLARIQAAPGATAPGDAVGTLRYMSPEQAAGDPAIDPRSDIYSLGATLYELLTLHPAFAALHPHECLHQVLEDEPVQPRRWNPAIPAELETIVLKAMSKTPAERYASARELAEDLRKYLDDRPIAARPPSLLDRTRRWVRRHPSLLWSVLLVLSLAAVGFGVFAVFAAREQARTQEALEREQQRAREAEERSQLIRQAADDLIRVSEEELVDRPFMEGPRQRLLEAALVYYQKLIEQGRDTSAAQEELIATQERVKKLHADLASLQTAGRLLYLAQPAIADALNLTREQRTQIEALFARQGARWAKWLREAGKLSSAERRAQFLDLPRLADAESRQILDAKQLARLRQISLQLQGPGAFREPEVVAALNLTAAQRARVREIEAELMFSGPGDGQWDRKVEAATVQVFTLLTPEQMAAWKKTTGAPLRGTVVRIPPWAGPVSTSRPPQ
jgi:serine/threonine protein kinase